MLPIVGLIAGIAIGYLVARSAPNRTQRQVDDLQERFDTYQSEVVTHFNTTASLLRKLTQNYRDIRNTCPMVPAAWRSTSRPASA